MCQGVARQQPKGKGSKEKANATGTRKTSAAWDHFEKLPDSEVFEPIAACKYCGKIYLCDSKLNGTSSMLAHIKFCPSSEGNIPSSVGEMKQLWLLDWSQNYFTGELPEQLANNCTSLEDLMLSNNFLQGQIIRKASRWTLLDILTNTNTENEDDEDCHSTFRIQVGWSINHVDVEDDDKYVSEELDWEFYMGLDNGGVQVEVEFRTKNNYYSYGGKILRNMTGLDLSCNELTGVIPTQIGYLQRIHALNLSPNFLSSSILNTFSNLTLMEGLDSSYNNLIGEIPYELSQFHSLAIFNVSYNNLGILPSSGKFANFDENNYRGNPNLCGLINTH
ncbi:hypothetical protein L6164_023555 [Bauhinia variegata]|uniref:Uncharacterized protein n=1 Tax=Bauhinia variegata TaxID=167791 RepID=A0ACB9MM04_BAUVA|nr:hypothetical protein L6164_023555 [Bauhinia variegata]